MIKKVPEITGRKSYTPDFRRQAIALAEELDSIPEAGHSLQTCCELYDVP